METAETAALIEQFAQEYQSYHRISEKRAREQRKLLREFGSKLAPRSLADATSGDLKAFAASMTGVFHVNTIRKKLNMIRPFYSWAYAAGHITADQYLLMKTVEDPRGATGRSVPNPYTPDEVRAYWAALEERWPLLPKRGRGSQSLKRWIQGKSPFRVVARHAMRLQLEAITRLALDAGLRSMEIYRLSVNDAHYDNAYILVDGAAKGENFDKDMTRKIPMTKELRKALHDWIEFRALMRPEHDRLWVTCYGPVTHCNPIRLSRWETLLSSTVGTGWELHRFRHTAATEWLRAGASLETVSALLGHENLQQTRAYTLIVEKDIERELSRVEENFNRRLRRAA